MKVHRVLESDGDCSLLKVPSGVSRTDIVLWPDKTGKVLSGFCNFMEGVGSMKIMRNYRQENL